MLGRHGERRSSVVKLFADPTAAHVVPMEEGGCGATTKVQKKQNDSSNCRIELALRYISITLMICQYVCQVLITRFASTRANTNPQQPAFIKTVAIVLKEALEAFVSFLLLFAFMNRQNSGKSPLVILAEPLTNVSMLLPALAYTLKNFLIFVAIDHLDAATFTVSYQLKILTTAVFLVLMLKRRLSSIQWLSLCVLVGGVAMVELSAKKAAIAIDKEEPLLIQLNSSSSNIIRQQQFAQEHTILTTTFNPALSSNRSLSSPLLHLPVAIPAVPHVSEFRMPHSQENFWLGFGAVLGACIFSGYAGVYLEKIVKQPGDSLWLRNFQLCFQSTLIASGIAILKDFTQIHEHGPLIGFDLLVWAVVLIQVLGGLLVAMVIRYGDNILKAFANSVAILGISLLSCFLFGSTLGWLFAIGTGLVVGSMVLYSMFPPKKAEKEEQQQHQLDGDKHCAEGEK